MAAKNETLRWLQRLGLSLLIGLLAGGLAYLISRGITTAVLIFQQQQFFSATVSSFSGGLEGLGPPQSDEAAGAAEPAPGANLPGDSRADEQATRPQPALRELRREVERLQLDYENLSRQIGLLIAGLVAAGSYIRLEQRASR